MVGAVSPVPSSGASPSGYRALLAHAGADGRPWPDETYAPNDSKPVQPHRRSPNSKVGAPCRRSFFSRRPIVGGAAPRPSMWPDRARAHAADWPAGLLYPSRTPLGERWLPRARLHCTASAADDINAEPAETAANPSGSRSEVLVEEGGHLRKVAIVVVAVWRSHPCACGRQSAGAPAASATTG